MILKTFKKDSNEANSADEANLMYSSMINVQILHSRPLVIENLHHCCYFKHINGNLSRWVQKTPIW